MSAYSAPLHDILRCGLDLAVRGQWTHPEPHAGTKSCGRYSVDRGDMRDGRLRGTHGCCGFTVAPGKLFSQAFEEGCRWVRRAVPRDSRSASLCFRLLNDDGFDMSGHSGGLTRQIGLNVAVLRYAEGNGRPMKHLEQSSAVRVRDD